VSRAEELIALAERVEALDGRNNGGDMTIATGDIARVLGWVRVPPSESRSRKGHWIAPEDCRDGVPVYDSLHGTDCWRSPPNWLWSLDAAMTLVPDNWVIASLEWWPQRDRAGVTLREVKDFEADGGFGFGFDESCGNARSHHRTPALALTAAALRARAAQDARP